MDMYFYTLVNIIVTIVFIVAVLFVAFRILPGNRGMKKLSCYLNVVLNLK